MRKDRFRFVSFPRLVAINPGPFLWLLTMPSITVSKPANAFAPGRYNPHTARDDWLHGPKSSLPAIPLLPPICRFHGQPHWSTSPWVANRPPQITPHRVPRYRLGNDSNAERNPD